MERLRKSRARKITLKDLDKRYEMIRKNVKDVPDCSFASCTNPVDATTVLGVSTACAYHRLLFDWWMYEVVTDHRILDNKRERRRAFKKWVYEIGKERADRIVLQLANDRINWEC